MFSFIYKITCHFQLNKVLNTKKINTSMQAQAMQKMFFFYF